MTIDEQLESLSQMQYPGDVDVAASVMSRIVDMPALRQRTSRPLWVRLSATAAAAVAILFVVNIATTYLRSYDDEYIAGSIAQLGDYSSWSTVEEAAANPYEFLYE